MSDSESDDESVQIIKSTEFNLQKSIKMSMLLSMFFLLLMTDVFVERVLEKMNPSFVNDRKATTPGIVAQAVMLTIAVVLVDYVVSSELI